MASAVCNSFKTEVLGGTHDLDTDVIKLALYTSSASLSASTTAYSSTNEVVGTGYTAAGNTLAGAAITLDGSTAIVDFTDTAWTTATITARYALIYNSSKSNKAIAVLDFTTDQTATNGTFTVVFPTANSSSAIIRLS
tara:strand:- start:32655 stop:33068 length:414 start_codon:yes stop_codon:yes gene_type:complete